MTIKGKQAIQSIPTFDDMGRLVAINGVKLPVPANNTDLLLAQRGAAASYMPVVKGQNNQMDDAYANTAFVQSPGLNFSPQTNQNMLQKQQANKKTQDMLLKFFGVK